MDGNPDLHVSDAEGAATVTKTTCPYCGVGCGVIVEPSFDGLSAKITGDPDHPANFGRLCSKGSALGETLSLEDRLLYPQVDGVRASWDTALDRVSSAFGDAIREHGPDSVAIYVSGQILTEDYYLANKLMKGFIGTANIDTNSRLCMASSVAGHKRAFGSDTVPGTYEDLERADLVVLVGSNLAWCHPVLFQRLRQAKDERGTSVVVIDPRETATCEIADLHLPLAPGTDVALFNGLLTHLLASGRADAEFISRHTTGIDDALGTAAQLSLQQIAKITGLGETLLTEFYERVGETERTVTVYSQGVNQSSAGTDKVNAIINCHLATGRIGKIGAGPFSVTGQPNAMGGRETGGLANMLAAHMELANPTHRDIVSRFWGVDRVPDAPGFKAVDLFEAVADGRITALWIMATNPVDSLPDADRVRAAIAKCPFVAVSDVTAETDTTELAHVLLPAMAWGEKDGTVTNSERRISRQKAFLDAPGEVKADWWQICEVAKRLGFGDAFAFDTPSEIFSEYAAMTGFENNGTRDLDISAHGSISSDDYDTLSPFQWPQPKDTSPRETRFFANGGFYTPDKRARFIATAYRGPASVASDRLPFALNTGRIRDQWHTMTRTAKTPRLNTHYSEPFAEVHPDDARANDIVAADLVAIENDLGKIIVRAVVTDRVPKGSVFVPMHWTGQFSSHGRVDALVIANIDPISGQPELKYSPVAMRKFKPAWFAFAVTSQRPSPSAFSYAAIAPCQGDGWRAELAGVETPENWDAFARGVLQPTGSTDTQLLAYHDKATAQYRFAAFADSKCIGLLYVGPEPVSVSRSWAIAQFATGVADAERLRLLAGRPGAGVPDRGAIICACFEVGHNDIVGAIAKDGAETVAAVGACTKAGTNCGSCRAEIGRLIHEFALAKAV